MLYLSSETENQHSAKMLIFIQEKTNTHTQDLAASAGNPALKLYHFCSTQLPLETEVDYNEKTKVPKGPLSSVPLA